MTSEQFDEFWEIECPKCNETIDLEVLINHFSSQPENTETTIKSKK
jgi:phage FluMu protein Com